MTFKHWAILAAALFVAACDSTSSDDPNPIAAFRMVNFTSEAGTFRFGDRTFLLQPHEVSEPQTISLDAGQVVVTFTGGATITVPVPARTEDQVLVVGTRGHPPGSMPGSVSFVLHDTQPFPQVTVSYFSTSTTSTNVDIFFAPAGGTVGTTPTATAVNETAFAVDAGVWQVVVRRTGTNEVIYRNPGVQLNTREPVGFFLVPRTGATGFEGVLVARNRTQTYPDVR